MEKKLIVTYSITENNFYNHIKINRNILNYNF